MMKLKIIKGVRTNFSKLLFLSIIIFGSCEAQKRSIIILELENSGVDFSYDYIDMKTDTLFINPHVINFKFNILKNKNGNDNRDCHFENLELIKSSNKAIETDLISVSDNEVLATVKPRSYVNIFENQKKIIDFDDFYYQLKTLKLNKETSTVDNCRFELKKSKSLSMIFTFTDDYVLIYNEMPNSDTVEKQIILNNKLISSEFIRKNNSPR